MTEAKFKIGDRVKIVPNQDHGIITDIMFSFITMKKPPSTLSTRVSDTEIYARSTPVTEAEVIPLLI